MSGHSLRDDKECENCGYAVDVAFCSKCGQKNVETRQTFPRLIGHFAEDLTHYDTAFWKSLKHLLFNPGRLTRIYLEGKRQEYVPPVKLYIFISFITFLIIGLLPESPVEKEIAQKSEIEIETAPTERDTIEMNGRTYTDFNQVKKDREEGKIGFFIYHVLKATFHARDHKVNEEMINDTMLHTIPKAIFLYMPIFTFWIWLLHGKRRWYFFDHGIFTLHYFSFLLLSFTIFFIIIRALSWTIHNETIIGSVTTLLSFILMGYMIFYFFRSHRRMYGETRLVSRLKSILLFFINMFCMTWVMMLLLYYALITAH